MTKRNCRQLIKATQCKTIKEIEIGPDEGKREREEGIGEKTRYRIVAKK
jgi:hypothetical protein